MPYVSRSMFEKHLKAQHGDDNLHVHAISNPEEAAQIAALKLVMNTNLRERLQLLDTERQNQAEYMKTIINQKNMQMQHEKMASILNVQGPHVLALLLHDIYHGRYRG